MQNGEENREKPTEPAGRRADAAEGSYRAMIDAAHEIILRFDMDGQITFANQGGLGITGYLEAELTGMNIADILPPDELETIRARLFDAPGSGSGEIRLHEFHFINRELALIPVEVNAIALPPGGAPSEILFFARDISGRKQRAEKQLIARKFQFLETLAAGIVDDLNNMFTPVIGNIDLAFGDIPARNNAFKRLSAARAGCEKIRAFIGRLNRIANTVPPDMRLRSVADTLRRAAGVAPETPGVRCAVSAPVDLWPVIFDEEQMMQALTGLIRNSAAAMHAGDTIEISAENMVISPEMQTEVPPGRYVRITVRDRGAGIPEEYLGQIFDPYVSLKDGRGRGMGLDFAEIYAIVRHHRGDIDVVSKQGDRTTVTLWLPAADAAEADKRLSAKHSPRRVTPRGRVLIMDDEKIVRAVAGQMLTALGYTVGLSGDGAEAIDRYQTALASGTPFDVVILDLNVTTGMGARQAIRELLKLDPDVRGIVSSGYSNDPEMTGFRKHGFCGVIEKPYNIRELEETLNRVMQNR
ncbi:hypothetical protein DENIS_4891 [Desulfonema ishimotonii]|uniref:histidine kinase n=1 Tax=Desulfonema ishimotonii TaxID=45657 RepID=A0A401G3S2_9BACT|nr:ATP-binding protein [Desulfonema ishimotonii]GBC63892.1 hypothetical protein DENIS_4891 [Desulfonema ishimotonii]